MKVVVIGLGVQGNKRKLYAGSDFVASIDPIKEDADFKNIYDVPIDSYDAALVCLPDEPKLEVLTYLIQNKKHILVEKPLWTPNDIDIVKLNKLAKLNNVICYTAYNHRFEPHFINMKKLIDSRKLGKIYSCRMFYGNGTAQLVRESLWRDKGAGVLPDLGSHLLDTINFWFDTTENNFSVISANCFENKSSDHCVLLSTSSNMRIELEMTLLSWRNHFTCDIYAENGSAHIESLCKWGPSKFTFRQRILPSGRPIEESSTLIKSDPTWKLEYEHFKKLILDKSETNLNKDLWLNKTLRELSDDLLAMVG